nr:DoxX family membrane protein [Candidatus Magasanikbacteria bacterium]
VFLPEWLGYIPIPAEMFVQLNGWMEVVGSVLLFFGVFTRAASFVLSLHLFFIALSVGGAVGVRDAVLAFAGFALAASKGDEWTVDRKYWSR